MRSPPPIQLPAFLCALVCALLLAMPASAANVTCATCGKVIHGRYLTHKGKAYCSQKCYEATLPKCANCGKIITGHYYSSGGRYYCSENCLSVTWPTCEICGKHVRDYLTINGHVYCREHGTGPRCAECMLPFAKGVKLDDGRYLCDACRDKAVMTSAAGASLYDLARRNLYSITGIRIDRPPSLVLVDRTELIRKYNGILTISDNSIRGFYGREEQITTTRNLLGREVKRETTVASESIYILYGQTRENFMATAIHELTHDLIADHFPRLREAPLWVQEGICQYVSAIYCRAVGYKDALRDIETSPHPIYGGGYRYLKQLVGDGNWASLKAWMEHVDLSRLPDSLPAEQPPGGDK